jgi:hypothetical protein
MAGQLFHRIRVDTRSAPCNAFEEAGRNAPERDQCIASILRRREHRVIACAQEAQRAAQIRDREFRAVCTDEDRGPRRPRERTLHALAQIATALKRRSLEQRMPARHVEFDRAAIRGARGAQRLPSELRMQARGAQLAEARDEPRLRLARHRRFCENDDHR